MHPQYLVRKGGYYYRPRAQGYTSDPAKAGRFTRLQAIAYSHPNGPDGPRDGIDYIHWTKVLPAREPWIRRVIRAILS